MAKPMRGGSAYAIGYVKGPIKIGVTSTRPRKRLGSARREMNLSYWDSEGFDVLAVWPHHYAYMVEKLTHFYLQDHHRTGEWFDVSIHKARRAVNQVIRLIDAGWKNKVTGGNWFVRHGIPESAVVECFGFGSAEVMSDWNKRLRDDWDRRKAERDASGETAIRQAKLAEARADFERYWRNEQARERRAIMRQKEAP